MAQQGDQPTLMLFSNKNSIFVWNKTPNEFQSLKLSEKVIESVFKQSHSQIEDQRFRLNFKRIPMSENQLQLLEDRMIKECQGSYKQTSSTFGDSDFQFTPSTYNRSRDYSSDRDKLNDQNRVIVNQTQFRSQSVRNSPQVPQVQKRKSTGFKCSILAGCNKNYKESENSAIACKFHSGKPIFHDLKKGWSCCSVIVYEWSEFEKIEPCCTGAHTNEDQDNEFWRSSTVQNASNALERERIAQLKTAEDFNREQEEKKKKDEEAKLQQAKTPVVKIHLIQKILILVKQRWKIYVCQQGMLFEIICGI